MRDGQTGPERPIIHSNDHLEHSRTSNVHLSTQRQRILGSGMGSHDDWKRSVGCRSPTTWKMLQDGKSCNSTKTALKRVH